MENAGKPKQSLRRTAVQPAPLPREKSAKEELCEMRTCLVFACVWVLVVAAA